MLKCREVAELVASDTWRESSMIRRLAVFMHLAMCRHCRAYVRQLRRIGAAARQLFDGSGSDDDGTARMTMLVREAAARARNPDEPDRQ